MPFNKPSRSTLCPIILRWSADAADIRRQLAALPQVALDAAEPVRSETALRLGRERPFRVMNQRARLFACYWAGWRPIWLRPIHDPLLRISLYERHREAGPKWLGGRP